MNKEVNDPVVAEKTARRACVPPAAPGYSCIERMAWWPIPLLLVVIAGFWVADLRTIYESRILMLLLNLVFTWLASLCICILTARGFLGSGQPGLLMFGCGSLLWGVTSLAAAVVVDRVNTTITVHNLGVFGAAACHLVGLLWRSRLLRPGRWLAVGYAGALLIAALVFWAASTGLTPPFFVQGQGGRAVRQVVLVLAIAMFAWVASQMICKFRRQSGAFYYWYGLGLALVAAGLTGVMMLSVQGSALGWASRLTQYLGSVYLIVAAVAAARETGTWKISLPTMEDTWLRKELLPAFQKKQFLRFALRYGSAVVAVAAAFGLRQAMEARVGPGLPAYILFAATGSAVVLFAGSGPGLLALLLTDLAVGYWILPPTGAFAIASPVDRLGLLIFTGIGLYFCALTELYRRNREKAAAFDREAAVRESRERYDLLSRYARDPLLLLETSGKIVEANQAAAEFYAYSHEALLTLNVRDLRRMDPTPTIERQRKEASDKGILFETLHTRSDGTAIPVEVSSRGVTIEGQPMLLSVVRDITERKQVEDQLREMSRRLSYHVDNSPLAVIEFGPDMRLVRWSAVAEQMFGWKAEEVLGKKMEDFRWIYQEDQPKVAEVSADLQRGATLRQFSANRNYRKDGSVIYCEWYNSSLLDASGKVCSILSLVLDITERKRVEEALRERDERFTTLLANLQSGVALVDDSGQFVLCNASFFRIFGLSSEVENVSSQDWTRWQVFAEGGELLPVDDHPVRKAARSGKPVRNQLVRVKRPSDGAQSWLLVSAEPVLKPDGRLHLTICTYYDITERKQIEEQNRALNEDVKLRSAELAASNKELEAFAYSVSHDLRTPLRTIDGFSRALSEDCGDKLDTTGQDYLQRIQAATMRMERLIDDLLSLSRLARLAIKPEAVDLSALARVIAAELQASDRNRKVEFLIAERAWVSGDAQLLRVVLDNLLGNAWKFSGKRPLAIIEFGVSEHQGQPAYFVRDNGAGFDMEFAGSLFGVFQRFHKENQFPGTGIGLATVQRIIHRHGGEVWAQSEVDKGATFFFILRTPT